MGDERGCSVLTCGRRPIRKSGKQKARTRIARRGRYDLFDDRSMPVICPDGARPCEKEIPARIQKRYSLAYLRMKTPAGCRAPRAFFSTMGLCQ